MSKKVLMASSFLMVSVLNNRKYLAYYYFLLIFVKLRRLILCEPQGVYRFRFEAVYVLLGLLVSMVLLVLRYDFFGIYL